jgi:hypothetical protein
LITERRLCCPRADVRGVTNAAKQGHQRISPATTILVYLQGTSDADEEPGTHKSIVQSSLPSTQQHREGQKSGASRSTEQQLARYGNLAYAVLRHHTTYISAQPALVSYCVMANTSSLTQMDLNLQSSRRLETL